MSRIGVGAELEHLAEHRDLARAPRRRPHRFERLAQRRRTGVVRIVDERDATRQPQQLAAVRRRPQSRGDLYNLRHRNFELDGNRRRGENI